VAVLVPGALLLGLVVLAGSRPAVEGCPGGADAVLQTTPEQVPDVVGLDVDAATDALEEAGVPVPPDAVRYVVDPAPRDTVLEQSGGACGEALDLRLASGGPFVELDEVPSAARDALGEDPGLVRRVPLSEGYLLQTDELLVGDCPSADLVASMGQARASEIRCFPTTQEVLVEVVEHSTVLGRFPGGRDAAGGSGDVTVYTPGAQAWTAEQVAGGWRLTVLAGTARDTERPRCGAASAYEVCAVRERADGATVATLQVLGERPLGTPFVQREAIVQTDDWRVRVLLAPVLDGSVEPPEDRRAPPTDGPGLVALADEALGAVARVTPP
jgi:hypothetical protein